MTVTAERRTTERSDLDAALDRLRAGAEGWAGRSLPARIALARSMLRGATATAERSVALGCAAKGVALGSPAEGDEWLTSPYCTIRFLRQTVASLTAIERDGNTPIGRIGETAGGRLTERVFPASRLDRLLFPGISGDVHFEPGVSAIDARRSRARLYRDEPREGRVCLVLGAGNINAIPAADVITKLFNEGKACLLKMNPVNAYLGPLLEEAFADAIADGTFAVVYGGGEEGEYLAHHPAVDEVHITGSDRTHDRIVWGPPGPERAERIARGRPLLEKPITSELGNVTPVVVVPGGWTDRELRYQAESVAGMVTQNAGYNCAAARMLVLPSRWALRDRFLHLVFDGMARAPARRAWYPGSADRYRALTAGRTALRRSESAVGTLPWTLVRNLDAEDRGEVAFAEESFCPVLGETDVGSEDPAEFLDAAVRFANDRLWGTLTVAICASARTMGDRATAGAVEEAIGNLRYGAVGLNVWPALAFGTGTGPWGAYPGSPLTDIQSGRGFVHNTRMLERVEKLVLRAPSWSPIKLPWFPSHRSAHVLGRRLTALESDGDLLRLPGVLVAALRA